MTGVRARRAPIGALVFLAFAILYLVSMGHDESFDVWSADLASWSIGKHGSPLPDLTQFPRFDHWPTRSTWIVQTATGQDAIGRAPGVIAAAVPLYWIWPSAEMSTAAGCVTAALITAGSVTLLFDLLRRHLPLRDALLATGVFGLTTPVWSVAADAMWPHTITVLGIIGIAWAAERERWWLAGIFGGIALWGRLHAAIICAAFGLLLAVGRRRASIALRIAAASGAALVLLMCWTHWMYGKWDPTSAYRVQSFTDNVAQDPIDLVNQLGFWVSPGRGMVVWTPVLLVLAPALARSWRSLPDWSRALVWSTLAYTIVQLALNRYTGGGSFFGYRIGLEMLAGLTPALALSAHRMGLVARRLFGPVVLIQFAVFAVGAFSDPAAFPDRDDRWTHNEFLPYVAQIPALATMVMLGAVLAGALAWRRYLAAGSEADTRVTDLRRGSEPL